MAFQFKQFSVEDSGCAMKVGTDGVLLGAWTSVSPLCNGKTRVLDVGTGSGLVALMIAQRLPEAEITAIDIDPTATKQAQENFCSSPWSSRLRSRCIPVQDYAAEHSADFHLIVCNPPYFKNSLKAPDKVRSLARHQDSLTLMQLAMSVNVLLQNKGLFSVILPSESEIEMVSVCADAGLQLEHRCYVAGNEGKNPKRVLLEFRKTDHVLSIKEDSLLILQTVSQFRSEAYQKLTQDFYL